MVSKSKPECFLLESKETLTTVFFELKVTVSDLGD